LVASTYSRLDGQRSRPISCALQGFGNLGRAAAYSLAEAGIQINAISDEYGFINDSKGLEINRLLRSRYGTPVGRLAPQVQMSSREQLFDLDVDMFVLAAGEDSISVQQAGQLQSPLVVVGSNCGLSSSAEQALHNHGVLVVPDFVGGIGGSASMEALFGAPRLPTPSGVLAGVNQIMERLVERIICDALVDNVPPRAIANRMAANASVLADEVPYGTGPYLNSAHLIASARLNP
jgi:glutamate dehydrogenase (NAD(P)+)